MIKTIGDLRIDDRFFDSFESQIRRVQHVSIVGNQIRVICEDGRVDLPKGYPVYIFKSEVYG